MLVTAAMLMDLRLLGLFSRLERAPFVGLLRGVALAAFAGAALTGLALFSIRATESAFNPAFLVKMGLIGLAGANALAHRLLAGCRPGVARATAVLSLLLWPSILVAGRFIGFL